MIARFAFVVVMVCLSGCGDERSSNKEPDKVFRVGVDSLLHLHSANNYIGYRITVSIEPGQAVQVGNELHVHGSAPNTPPAVVFQLLPGTHKPDTKARLFVTGWCGAPVRDGVWRSVACDYALVIRECVVVPEAPP